MELTEKERRMLVEKKEEIRRLTEDIIELSNDVEKKTTELEKRVTSILSLISTITSYTNSKKVDMYALMVLAQHVFYLLETEPTFSKTELLFFCNIVNSLTFSFTKKGLKVNIQKIDLSIFKM